MTIAKRFDALVRGRFIARKLTTPIHSEKQTTVLIAIQSVRISGSEIELPDSEPHACESGTGKRSTTRLTRRRVQALLMSAIGSSRWSRARLPVQGDCVLSHYPKRTFAR